MTRIPRNSRGMVLVVAVVAVTFIAMLGAGFLLSTRAQAERTQISEESVALLNIAEAGVAAAIDEISQGGDGNVSASFGAGTYDVSAVQDGDYYTLVSTASNGEWSRSIEAVVLQSLAVASMGSARAAIESLMPVVTSGNFTVDGRDWGYDGSSVVGDGVYGVSCMSTVTRSGSSQIGGNGVAPSRSSNIYEQLAYWGDHVNNDGDLVADEEVWDGLDDDLDGQVDEDTYSFPLTPDLSLGLAEGTLKEWAEGYGTYFTSEGDLNDYISENGGVLPGGKVYYLEFDSWNAASFGEQSSDTDPSILVMHNTLGNAEMRNVHGTFRGLMMADAITHINAGTVILGHIKSFAEDAAGNAYGNGNATVRYSSSVLSMLPADPTGGSFARISWRALD